MEHAQTIVPAVRSSLFLAILDALHIHPTILSNAIALSSAAIVDVRDFLGLNNDNWSGESDNVSDDITADTASGGNGQPVEFDPSSWYDMDMTVWPPTNVRLYETHSFIYAPIIMDALGHEIAPGVYRSLFPFPRPIPADGIEWDNVVRAVRQHFINTGGIDHWRGNIPLDGPLHPTAQFQEELFYHEDLNLLGQDIAWYATHLVRLNLDKKHI